MAAVTALTLVAEPPHGGWGTIAVLSLFWLIFTGLPIGAAIHAAIKIYRKRRGAA
jgi:hypothetical protein